MNSVLRWFKVGDADRSLSTTRESWCFWCKDANLRPFSGTLNFGFCWTYCCSFIRVIIALPALAEFSFGSLSGLLVFLRPPSPICLFVCLLSGLPPSLASCSFSLNSGFFGLQLSPSLQQFIYQPKMLWRFPPWKLYDPGPQKIVSPMK